MIAEHADEMENLQREKSMAINAMKSKEEGKTLYERGGYVDFSPEENAIFNPYTPRSNKLIHRENVKEEDGINAKSLYISHGELGECVPPKLRNFMKEFPNVTNLHFECPEAKDVNIEELPWEKLERLDLEAPSYNHRKYMNLPFPADNDLNKSLQCIPTTEKLKELSIDADNLTADGIKGIAENCPNLERLNTDTFNASDDFFLPLVFHDSLQCINHRDGTTGSYMPIDKLNETRRKNGLPIIPRCSDYDRNMARNQ